MTVSQKHRIRAAVSIHAALARLHARPHPPPKISEHYFEECRALVHGIGISQTRGWHGVAAQLQQRLPRAIERVQSLLQSDRANAAAALKTMRVPNLHEILEAIRSLEDEFPVVRIDLRGRLLCVQTESVVLDDTELGPFEIQLDWRDFAKSQPYEVVALDSVPASSNSDVTHPHVQDGRLCEGDGRPAIRQALEQGRLDDFFQLISSILHTYNPDSAYVRLDNWSGTPCEDCGIDSSYPCSRCGATLCDECGGFCSSCHDCYCASCTETCAGCDARCCHGCLDSCADCEESFCKTCLTDERCFHCHEDKQPSEGFGECDSLPACEDKARDAASTPEAPSATKAGTALQPDRLGEAVVSA